MWDDRAGSLSLDCAAELQQEMFADQLPCCSSSDIFWTSFLYSSSPNCSFSYRARMRPCWSSTTIVG